MSDSNKKSAREYEYDAAGVRLTIMYGVIPMFYKESTSLTIELFHTHSWFEIFCATKQPITLYFEDHVCRLAPGEAIIIPPGLYHYAIFPDLEDKEFAFDFSVQYLEKSETARTLQGLLPTNTARKLQINHVCENLINYLINALDNRNSVLCGTYLLALLLNFSQCNDPSLPTARESSTDNKASRIYKIEQAIFTHFTGQLPIKRLAEELHLSQRQVSRIIQQHYGTSYRSKNKDLRMQAAARKLQRGMPIAQVATEEGYNSLSAFYTAFRKTFGMTPAQYQKKHNA